MLTLVILKPTANLNSIYENMVGVYETEGSIRQVKFS